VLQREASHGVKNAFRFKAVLSSRKKGTLGPSHYIDDDEDSQSNKSKDTHLVPLPRKHRKQRPAIGNTAILNPEISEEPLVEPATSTLPGTLGRPINSSATQDVQAQLSTDIRTTAIAPTGLQTPNETPDPQRILSTSPPPRNRSQKKKRKTLDALMPEVLPANASSSEPRRSSRKSVQKSIDKPKGKVKKGRKKLRG
jgi:hypothetical protein